MSRPEFYVVSRKGGEEAWLLCRCCAAVLVCEGRVAGDPTAKGLSASDVGTMQPSEVAHCDTCDALRRFEERRASLGAPPQRIGESL